MMQLSEGKAVSWAVSWARLGWAGLNQLGCSASVFMREEEISQFDFLRIVVEVEIRSTTEKI